MKSGVSVSITNPDKASQWYHQWCHHLCAGCPGGVHSLCSNRGKCDDGHLGNGTCTCEAGFQGTACELCSDGFYGPTCKGKDFLWDIWICRCHSSWFFSLQLFRTWVMWWRTKRNRTVFLWGRMDRRAMWCSAKWVQSSGFTLNKDFQNKKFVRVHLKQAFSK